jgi:hypothetical protein
MEQTVVQRDIRSLERAAWTHLLAGPVIYSVYFIVGYMIAEAGCKTEFLSGTMMGINAVSAVIVVLTGVTALVLLYEVVTSYRHWRRYQNAPESELEVHKPFVWMSGLLLSALFALMTISTGISIFALQPCEWI